jgi:ADP-ribose pyrophosphatase
MQQGGLSKAPLGSWRKGEIEIILNPEQIKKIEKQTKLRLISKGIPESTAEKWSSVGVVAEDSYWMWIRDAVIFPSGVYGTYDRLLWKTAITGDPGVAILPILASKKIVVNLNYRHATRSWEIELPRGGVKKEGESLELAAQRELKEETGYQLNKPTLLGTVAPDSGTIMNLTVLFYGEVSHSGETHREFSEAISQNPAFTKQEIKEGIIRGYIEVPIQGQIVRVNCRDPLLAVALIQAEGKGLL